jgi:rhamnulokinase
MATGDVRSLAEAREVVRASFDVKRYAPQQPKAWQEAYGRYRELLGRQGRGDGQG